MLLCLGFRDGGCLVKGFEILLYAVPADLACRLIAKDSEYLTEITTTSGILAIHTVATVFRSKFLGDVFILVADDNNFVKLL